MSNQQASSLIGSIATKSGFNPQDTSRILQFLGYQEDSGGCDEAALLQAVLNFKSQMKQANIKSVAKMISTLQGGDQSTAQPQSPPAQFQGADEQTIAALVQAQQQTAEGQRQLRKLNNMLTELKKGKEAQADRNHFYSLVYGLVQPNGPIELAVREQGRAALGLDEQIMPDFIEFVDGQLIIHEDKMLSNSHEQTALALDTTQQLMDLLSGASQNDRRIPLLPPSNQSNQ